MGEQRRHVGRMAAALAVVSMACGGGEEPEAHGASMSAPEPASPVAVERSEALNTLPVVASVRLEPASPRPGERVSAVVDASDDDGDPVELVFQWRVAGRTLDEKGDSIHVDAEKGERIDVAVTPNDGHGRGATARATVRVGNLPPVIQGVVLEPLDQLRAGRDVAAAPRAMDPDGDEISYRFRWDVNGQTVLGATGSVLSHEHYERGDVVVLTVWASDGSGESEPLESDAIEVVNAPPKITSVPGGIGADGVFRYPVTAEDPDEDRDFRFQLAEGPAGMEIDFVDGTLVWTPGEDQAGRHPVKIEVRDLNGAKSQQTFVVEVGFDAEPPAATPES